MHRSDLLHFWSLTAALTVLVFRSMQVNRSLKQSMAFPVFFTLYPNAAYEVDLVTEYPDKTVYGVDFNLGHQMQMETVQGAYEAWQGLTQENS